MKKTIVFDAQILQTAALSRGMGQYVIALLHALSSQTKKSKDTQLVVLLSSKINNQNTTNAKQKLSTFNTITLPLISAQQTKNTLKAIERNKKVLESWLEAQTYDEVTVVLGSLFQADIYPAFPSGAKKMAIMYDTIPLQYFDSYASRMNWDDYLNRFRLVFKADTLLCISKTTANDLQVYVGISEEKIDIIQGGPGEFKEQYRPDKEPNKPFILMPTGNDIRKNNHFGIRAFERFRQKDNLNYTLVITSEFTDEEKKRLSEISPSVVFTGVLDDETLAWYFSNCSALLFPSLYEGLGMPLIEAVMFDKPIASSNIDVLEEISETAPYFFEPTNEYQAAEMIELATQNVVNKDKKSEYKRITETYTWENTARQLLDINLHTKKESSNKYPKKRIAVVGPHVTGVSAIGKFISELHGSLIERYDVEYYYEKSSVDKKLRPNILGHIAHYKSIYELTDKKIRNYDAILYHIGNSNHHAITLARALTKPSIVIMHDLNIENAYKELVHSHLIAQKRMEYEADIDKNEPTNSSYIQTLAKRQKAVITHSSYAQDIVKEIVRGTNTKVFRADLSVSTPHYDIPSTKGSFTIGLAGILAGIKGIEAIEELAKDPEFASDRVLIFGLNFAEPGLLDRLRKLPNVEVTTDLTDFGFQEKLKRLDVFVNFRTKYQGEASYATLEAMRYGIPVVVRGDFGWYAELPNNSVIKVENYDEVITSVKKLKSAPDFAGKISASARQATKDVFNAIKYVDLIEEVIKEIT